MQKFIVGPQSKKKVRQIWITESFITELAVLNKFLIHNKVECEWVGFPIPTHLPVYSASNEIELRYYAFEEMDRLIRSIINQFIPSDQQAYYIDKIPTTPILESLKEFKITNNIIDPIDYVILRKNINISY